MLFDIFNRYFFTLFIFSFFYSYFFKENLFFYIYNSYFFLSLIFIFYFNSEYVALYFNICLIFFLIFSFLICLSFFKNENSEKEDYFLINFDISQKNILYLALHFSILHVIYDNMGTLNNKNIPIISLFNKVISNQILEVIFLSIIASIIFGFVTEIKKYRDNFLKYQKLSYALKYLWCHINGINKSHNELLFQDILFAPPSFNHFKDNDFFISDLKFLSENKELFFNNLIINDINNFEKKILEYLKDNNVNKPYINKELSLKLNFFIKSLKSLKSNPFIYILNSL